MVSWEFVEEMLKVYGFPLKFRQLIMSCITSTKFTVRINGNSFGYFTGRGG